MAEFAPHYEPRQEFWKPIVGSKPEGVNPHADAQNLCRSCGAEIVLVGRFCHLCGADRSDDQAPELRRGLATWFDLAAVREAAGLNTAALAALLLGCGCLAAVIVTGFAFKASTVLEWQAIQLWRIEWLLASIAGFAAGLLLKKR